MIQKQQIDTCVEVARKYGATKVVLFGSAAVDPGRARDIDLVCDGVNGFDLIRMGAEMEERARALIDVVTARPLTPLVEFALEDGKVLYEYR